MANLKKSAINKQKLMHRTEKGRIDTKGAIKKTTVKLRQRDIARSVDITNASKHFELDLNKLGPYKCDYYRNGRYLLLGGRRGHVATIDWVTKDLICEFNLREEVHAVKWLHVPSMFAVSQKEWVHIYDKDGVELNVIKTMYRSIQLDFLEHYFLLASASDGKKKSYVTWKDISIGKDIANFPTKPINHLTHNPYNGLLLCSHPNGTVSMWSPNHNRAAVSILCHPAPIRSSSITIDGNYMATAGIEGVVKVWDLRNSHQCIKQHHLHRHPDSIDFSQLGLLAVGAGKEATIYRNVCKDGEKFAPYLKHNLESLISDVQFCNFEDVLGVGHKGGFTSLLVPGSGEPNFDSHESNPFMSKSQQREMEIKMLLDKISHEMICLDPSNLAKSREN